MLDRQKGDIVFECDGGCGDVLETETSNFGSALNIMKRDGWRAQKVGVDWSYYCPNCFEKL